MSDRSRKSLIRSLLRNPVHALPVVLLLGLTGGAVLAMVALLQGVLFAPLPFPESDRIVSLCERHAQLGDWCGASTPAVEALVEQSGSLSAGGAGRSWVFTLEDGGEAATLSGGLMGPGFFQALGVTPVLGRLPGPTEVGPEDGRVVLLGHDLWTTRFGGDPAVVGRSVRLDGEPHVVVGVLPGGWEVPDIPGARIWRPLLHRPADPEQRGWRGFVGVARLAPEVSMAQARNELSGLYRRLEGSFDEIDASWRFDAVPLVDRLVGGVRAQLWLFAGAVAFFVLVGAANVLNLFVFRRLRLQNDDRVRKALGAPRGHRLARSLREAAVLGAAGALLAGGAGFALLRVLLRLAPPELPRLGEVGLDPGSVTTVSGLVLAIALLAAALATTLTAGDGNPSNPARTGGSRRVRVVRDGLVALETGLALLLVAAAAVLGRSFWEYTRWNPGFETSGLAAVQLFANSAEVETSEDAARVWGEVERTARELPGVRAGATVSAGPLFGGTETSVYLAGEVGESGDPGALPTLRWYDAGPEYFATLGRPLVAGREIRESDVFGGERVAVVSRTLAEEAFPPGDALGRTLTLPELGLSFRIVGVAADAEPLVPGAPPEAEVFWSNRQLPRWGSFLVLRLEPGTSVQGVDEALEALEPRVSVGTLRPLEARFRQALVGPRFLLFLLGTFALLATLLAAGGLFAVLSVSVAERHHELGVRIALGASRTRVLRETLLRGTGVAALGVGAGALTFLLGEGVLVSAVPGVAPAGPALVGAALVLLLATALGAALPPSVRASRADPVELLRES